jgi:hypothetical protein
MSLFDKPSGGMGVNSRLPGFMNYGPSQPQNMSMAPAADVVGDPNMAALTPLAYTGDNGQVADLANLTPMAYGMSPAGADVMNNLGPVAGGGGAMDGLISKLTDPKFMFGGKNTDGSSQLGAIPTGLGAIQGIAGLYMGMQQYGLAKKQLEEGKRRYDQDYAANKNLTNARLEDRQKARVADGRPGAYESVSSYMAKNGVK